METPVFLQVLEPQRIFSVLQPKFSRIQPIVIYMFISMILAKGTFTIIILIVITPSVLT